MVERMGEDAKSRALNVLSHVLQISKNWQQTKQKEDRLMRTQELEVVDETVTKRLRTRKITAGGKAHQLMATKRRQLTLQANMVGRNRRQSLPTATTNRTPETLT